MVKLCNKFTNCLVLAVLNYFWMLDVQLYPSEDPPFTGQQESAYREGR
jgi:hypothetical protein